ncbi:MAG: acyl--CoA ligase [Actinobacteria bacterium]|nr:acyl--CoA ligase [Actinomycetota bacterium]
MFGDDTAVRDLVAGRGVHLGLVTSVLAQRYGDRVVVEEEHGTPGIGTGGIRTAVQVEDAVARLAAAHEAAGRREDERVLVLLGNRYDILLHAFALARVGAVAVPVNPRLQANEVAAIAGSSGARAVVADDDVAAELRDHGDLADLAWSTTGSDDASSGLAGWLGDHPDARIGPVARDASATSLLLTTSGTTGTPKAAALSSRGLLSALGRLVAAPVGRSVGPRGDRDSVVAALPLTHIMGFSVALGTLCAGVPLLHRSSFDADEVLTLIEERRPNVFIGVPTMYADLESAGAADRDLGSIQLWGSAADAMPADRARRFQRYGGAIRVAGKARGTAVFVDIYGMVELSGAAAVRVYLPSPSERVDVPSFAVVLPGIEARVVDEDRRPVGRGKEGELEFRGESVLSGYEGREDAGPDEAGWFATGDHARLYPGGVFQFAGRSRDRIKVGGFSVFPAEVETDLREHPDVADVALVGVPDDRLGERPVALLVPTAGDVDTDAYLAWASDAVAGYRRPQAAFIIDALPRGNNGKVDRQAATDLAVERLAAGADA